MRNGSTSRELIVGGADMPAPGDIEVLYVDTDAAIREWTRAAMADRRGDLSVASVGTVETHLPALGRIGLLDCDERSNAVHYWGHATVEKWAEHADAVTQESES